MSTEITLQIAPRAARELRRQEPEGRENPEVPESLELRELVAELGLRFEEMHPGSDEPTLIGFFTARVPEEADPGEALERLRSCAAVEAAYVKPLDELP